MNLFTLVNRITCFFKYKGFTKASLIVMLRILVLLGISPVMVVNMILLSVDGMEETASGEYPYEGS